ncbi:DUF4349 domain-containing protein [Leptospira wolffii]|uniref:DUF4349 domain-containing protein n=1 Tax=Leptospira wolffii TaxID=409998 RepID=A0ABV5BJ64_9LEPT|nr:DUF4349 domain-containing protein [Leptospira wolffii]TGL49063.1 DUF4349 domain-containing protein [Leptospira wolffii]
MHFRISTLFILFYIGCASTANYDRAASFKEASATDDGKNSEPRIIVYDARLELETKDPETVSKAIADLAGKYEGYTVVSGNRYTKIRVLSKYFQKAISDIETLGEVTDKEVSGKDVTEEFTDTKIRLENKTKARDRYLELLKKAENVEATLKVEKELERLNTEIESYKGKIESLSHLAKYSTVQVRIEKKKTLGPLGYVFWAIGKGIRLLFVWD